MSEQKPEPLQNLLQEMNDRLAKLTEQVKQNQSQKQEPSQSTEKHTHTKHSADVNFECPECEALYNAKVSAKAIKEFKEKMKKGEIVECEDCGELVEKETEECPTCHGRNARVIR